MRTSAADLLKLIEYYPDRVVPPLAWGGHIHFADFLVRFVKPAVVVELGTHSGNSLCAFAQSVKREGLSSQLFAVDTWQGDEQAGFYSDRIYRELKVYTDQNYPFVRLLRKTFDEARDDFQDDSVDLLHIDGLHTYEAVKHDFETWLPRMRPTGIVLFHDVSVKREGFGVLKFWEELKHRYSTLEFDHSNGLGVLFLPRSLDNPELKRLYDEFQSHALRDVFATFGDRLVAMESGKRALEKNRVYQQSRTDPAWISRSFSFRNLTLALAMKVRSRF